MAVYTKVEFKNLCRLCISFSQSSEDIFGDKAPCPDLNLKISNCLSIKIEEEDSLPKKICKNCLGKLISFNEFRLSCFNSDSTLQCYYSLFKSTIDFDGTIFIKSDDVVQDDGDNGTGLVSTTTDILPGSNRQTCNDFSGTLIDQNMIASSLSLNNNSNVSSLQSQDFIKPSSHSNLNVTNLSDIGESFPLVANNDDIVVLDMNKCNIFDFIDPRAPIYVVNVDEECKDNAGREADNQELVLSDKNEMSAVLRNPCTPEDVIYEPKMDQSDIKNINEFLRNIYPNQKPKDDTINPSSDSGENILLTNMSHGSANNSSKSILHDMSNRENKIVKVVEESQAKSSIDAGIVDFTSVLVNSSKTSLDIRLRPEINQPSGNNSIELQMSRQSLSSATGDKDSSNTNLQDMLSTTKSKLDTMDCSKKPKKPRKVKPAKDPNIAEGNNSLVDNGQNECLLCHESFDQPKALKTHMKIHQEKKIFKCQYCNKCFGRNWHRNRHIEYAHNPHAPAKKEFVCHICSKKYAREEHLTKHMLVHSRVYECEKCSTILDTEASFRRHKSSNCLVKHVCEKCGAQFDSKTRYLQHINSKCGQDTVCIPLVDKSLGFKCTLCNCSFTARWILKRHMEQHKRVESSIARDVSGEMTIQPNRKRKNRDESQVNLVEDIPMNTNDCLVSESQNGSTSTGINNKSHIRIKSSLPTNESVSDLSVSEKSNQEALSLSKPFTQESSIYKDADKKVRPTIEVNFGQFIKDLLKKPSHHQRSIHALLDSLVAKRSKQTSVQKQQMKNELLNTSSIQEVEKCSVAATNSETQHFQDVCKLKEVGKTINESIVQQSDIDEREPNSELAVDKDNKSSLNEMQIDDFLLRIAQNLFNDESSVTSDSNIHGSKMSSSLNFDTNAEESRSEDKFTNLDLTGKLLSSLEESYRKYKENSRSDHPSQVTVTEVNNTDLVLSINDNLPDTLLNTPSNYESFIENGSNKVIPMGNEQRHFSEESAHIFESELDNLLDSTGTTFDNDLENLLDEAANNFEECVPQHFPVGNTADNMLKNTCSSTEKNENECITDNTRNIPKECLADFQVTTVSNDMTSSVIEPTMVEFPRITDSMKESRHKVMTFSGQSPKNIELNTKESALQSSSPDLSENGEPIILSQEALSEKMGDLSVEILPTPESSSVSLPKLNYSTIVKDRIQISRNNFPMHSSTQNSPTKNVQNRRNAELEEFSKPRHDVDLSEYRLETYMDTLKRDLSIDSQKEIIADINKMSFSSEVVTRGTSESSALKLGNYSINLKPILEGTTNLQEMNTSKDALSNKIEEPPKEKCCFDGKSVKYEQRTVLPQDFTIASISTGQSSTTKGDVDISKDTSQITENLLNITETSIKETGMIDEKTSQDNTNNCVGPLNATGSLLKKSIESYPPEKCIKRMEGLEHSSEHAILGQFNSEQDLREFVKYSQKILSPVVRISRTIVTKDKMNQREEESSNEYCPGKEKLMKYGVKQNIYQDKLTDDNTKDLQHKTPINRKMIKETTKDVLPESHTISNYLDKCVVFLPKVDTSKLNVERDDLKRQQSETSDVNLNIKRQKFSKEVFIGQTKDKCIKLDQFHSTSVDKTISKISEEPSKQPIKTIRILLERFNPRKIAQYAEKDSKPFLAGSFAQPYNLRKTKDVQTYICTMEDS